MLGALASFSSIASLRRGIHGSRILPANGPNRIPKRLAVSPSMSTESCRDARRKEASITLRDRTEKRSFWTFNAWTSEEARESFVDQILKPALDSVNQPLGDVQKLDVSWDSSQMRGQS